MSLGDVISQLAIERKGFDLKRNARFMAFGLFIGGPMFRVWYLKIDQIFGKTKYSNLKMVFADQGLFAPVFLPFFLGTMGVMRQDPFPLVVEKVKNIWPLAQLINFTFVPLQHRVMVVNLVSVGWNTYLAWKSEVEHESIVHDVEEEEEFRHSKEHAPISSQVSKVTTPSVQAVVCLQKTKAVDS
ncbi:hypothetical protein FSP39_012712 [Pinctada imbricata]|uniref:Mitochondrial inner membrane protein Mpv17 n=1 Tax=Pinctada imbricata TaxID=66713 RepID=A0AA88XVA5_PINIB|nr:hypothetical protein FSP39_012712 [Pinctada imbricata]